MATDNKFGAAEIRVVDGAKLQPDRSADRIGPANYSTRQGWRRDGDHEIEREGWLDFLPNAGGNANNQKNAFSTSGDIRLLHHVKRANGQTELIAIGRRDITSPASYSYLAARRFDYANSGWVDISTDTNAFEATAPKRLQSVDCGSYVVANNGIGLPRSWVVGDSAIQPIHELREQGIISVGDITEAYGVLKCSDIVEAASGLSGLMNGPRPYGAIAFDPLSPRLVNAALHSEALSKWVTGGSPGVIDGDLFTSTVSLAAMLGMSSADLIYSDFIPKFSGPATFSFYTRRRSFNSVSRARLIDVAVAVRVDVTISFSGGGFVPALTISAGTLVSSQHLGSNIYRITIAAAGDIAAGNQHRIEFVPATGSTAEVFIGGFQLAPGSTAPTYIGTGSEPVDLTLQRIAYRTLWSNIGNPRDFAATVPGSITSGSPTLTLSWPMASFAVGDELTVIGAGAAGGNLRATIESISGKTVTLSSNAGATVADADVQKTTALNSIVGYKDLSEDGSAILRVLPLGNRVVAYKQSGDIFVGYFTGDLDEPFVYERVYSPKGQSRGLVFPYTLIDVGGRYHLYAGESEFYRFSLGAQEPEIHEVFRDCRRSLFFSRVSTADLNDIFSVMNGCTNEVFVCYPYNDGTQKYAALAYDFTEGHECIDEITDFNFRCAATIQKPNGDKSSDPATLWFVMGTTTGTVATYGKSNLAILAMNRFGAAWTRVLEWGFNPLGDGFNEKDVRSFVPLAAGGTTTSATLKLYGVNRTTATPSLLTTKAFSLDRLAALFFRRIYFKVRLEVATATTVGARIAGYIMEFARVKGRSITRL